MDIVEIGFWACAACVLYTYAGYPLLVGTLARVYPRPRRTGPYTGSVTVIVAAHNEETAIARRLDELTAQLGAANVDGDIIVVSDGSTDGTAVIARGFTKGRVPVLELPERVGKAAALTRACAEATGDVLGEQLGHLRRVDHPRLVREHRVVGERELDLADHAHVVLEHEDGLEAGAKERVIVGDHDPDGRGVGHAVGIAIVSTGDWQLGIRFLAGALCVAAFLRLVLPARDAGMLAVRNRFVDAFLLGGVGAAILFLVTTIPNQRG